MDDYKLWVEFRNQKAQRKQILKRIFSVMDRARLVAELTGDIDPKIVFERIFINLYKKDKKKIIRK